MLPVTSLQVVRIRLSASGKIDGFCFETWPGLWLLIFIKGFDDLHERQQSTKAISDVYPPLFDRQRRSAPPAPFVSHWYRI